MIAKDTLFARVAAGAPLTNSEAAFLCQLCDGFAWLRALQAAGSASLSTSSDEATAQAGLSEGDA